MIINSSTCFRINIIKSIRRLHEHNWQVIFQHNYPVKLARWIKFKQVLTAAQRTPLTPSFQPPFKTSHPALPPFFQDKIPKLIPFKLNFHTSLRVLNREKPARSVPFKFHTLHFRTILQKRSKPQLPPKHRPPPLKLFFSILLINNKKSVNNSKLKPIT